MKFLLVISILFGTFAFAMNKPKPSSAVLDLPTDASAWNNFLSFDHRHMDLGKFLSMLANVDDKNYNQYSFFVEGVKNNGNACTLSFEYLNPSMGFGINTSGGGFMGYPFYSHQGWMYGTRITPVKRNGKCSSPTADRGYPSCYDFDTQALNTFMYLSISDDQKKFIFRDHFQVAERKDRKHDFKTTDKFDQVATFDFSFPGHATVSVYPRNEVPGETCILDLNTATRFQH